MPIFPSFLSKGDTVLVISPSGKVDEAAVRQSCVFLENKGFNVEVGEHVFMDHFKFAGTHLQRLSDLQWALDHSHAKAIFCARGGFGVTHIIDKIDWTIFHKYPKWVIGFSDITALHHAIYKQGFCSIHGPVLQSFFKSDDSDRSALIRLLLGDALEMRFSFDNLIIPQLDGELVGGNLSLIINQLGTATEINFDNKLLFLEEVGEHLYHIDRMMLQLKRCGKLTNLAGLLIGDFTNMNESKDIFGQDITEIIAFHCNEYEYPILKGVPVGHGNRNWPVIHGGNYRANENSFLGPLIN